MKKILTYAVSAMLLVSLFAGCNSSGGGSQTNEAQPAENQASNGAAPAGEATPAGDGETIRWLTQGPGETSWEFKTKPILEKYKEEFGVEVVADFFVFNDLMEVIEVRIAAGTDEYDVISADGPLVSAYANRGYLAPLDPYFTDEEKSAFIDSSLEAGSFNGSFYAAPMNTSSQLLWYNKALLDEAGVTIRDNDVNNRLTWDEVEGYANQVLDAVDPDRNLGYAGIIWEQIGRTYQMCPIPNSMGEPSIGPDGYTVDGIINGAGWNKAMTWYQGLFDSGLSLKGITAEETKNYFNSGKIVFMVGATYMPSRVEDVDLGFAPVPAFAGYESSVATPTGSWHFATNSGSGKQDAAAHFVKWFSMEEGNEMWLEINGDVPATHAGIEALNNNPDSSDIMKIAAYEAANTAVPRAVTPGYSEYSTTMDSMFEDIRNGSDVQGSLDSAVSQITSAMEKYQ